MKPGPAVPIRLARAPGVRGHRLARALGLLLLVLCGWLVWPYLTLWRLDRALFRDDQAALASLVDLPAVREALRRSLDKEVGGPQVPFSDRFIDWLQKGIRRRGTRVLEHEVTLAWVRDQLLYCSPPGAGLGPALSWAFFDDPLRFSLHLCEHSEAPVRVRLRFTGSGWRVSALHY